MKQKTKTAESITPMHPDKICDRISDAILTESLKQDKNSRVAIETIGGHNIILIMGEMTTNAYVDVNKIVKRIVGNKYGIINNIVRQSSDIARGVDIGGAGDQGIMVGYACNENKEMIPQELYLARNLCKFIYDKYKEDGKTQITLVDGKIDSIVASFCNVSKSVLGSLVRDWLGTHLHRLESKNVEFHINPAGDWTIGGFEADTGLTGRKLVCDNYGPQIPIGGGAFSGKDPSKVDRSGAYMARKLAVDLLIKNKAKEVYVYLAYAIGVKQPVQATAIVDGVEMPIISDCSPKNIIEKLKLKEQNYEEVAEWGSFGNGFIWDKLKNI